MHMVIHRFILFLLLGGFFNPSDVWAQQHENKTDPSGKRTGMWKVAYPDKPAQIQMEGAYKAGTRVGLWKFYSKQGQLKSESEYLDNGNTANVKMFHSNGKLAAEGLYRNKLREGTWYFYGIDSDTIPLITEIYSKGKREGKAIHRYFTGQIFETYTYSNGLKNGRWEQFYPSGKLKGQGAYRQDSLQGPVTYFYENGRLYMDGFYVADLRHGTFTYYHENGKVKMVLRYRYGVLNSEDAAKIGVPENTRYIPEERFQMELRKTIEGLDGGP
jgi:uncharacterized protein